MHGSASRRPIELLLLLLFSLLYIYLYMNIYIYTYIFYSGGSPWNAKVSAHLLPPCIFFLSLNGFLLPSLSPSTFILCSSPQDVLLFFLNVQHLSHVDFSLTLFLYHFFFCFQPISASSLQCLSIFPSQAHSKRREERKRSD